jgi:hypothetical protein
VYIPSIIISSSIREKISYPTLFRTRYGDTLQHHCIFLKTSNTFTSLPSVHPWVLASMEQGCVHGVPCSRAKMLRCPRMATMVTTLPLPHGLSHVMSLTSSVALWRCRTTWAIKFLRVVPETLLGVLVLGVL